MTVSSMCARHTLPAGKKPRRTNDGELTELGSDVQAIAGILWHATQTNWFKFHAGLKLIFFRFPAQYCQIARDGVPVHFEHPGPTTQDTQPEIADPKIRAMAKDKILKVLQRRYLLTMGIKVKLLIKYFAVPKGDDNVRMVYDATANKLNECV